MFKLEISTDNAAMEYPEDVAETLQRVAAQVADHGSGSGNVRDLNGNTIGQWSLVLTQFEDRTADNG